MDVLEGIRQITAELSIDDFFLLELEERIVLFEKISSEIKKSWGIIISQDELSECRNINELAALIVYGVEEKKHIKAHKPYSNGNIASEKQKVQYEAYKKNPERVDGIISFALNFDRVIDLHKMQAAINKIIKRNLILTADFYFQDGKLMYDVNSVKKCKMLIGNAANMLNKPFALENHELLVRAVLNGTNNSKVTITFNIHSIVFSYSCIQNFISELIDYYNEKDDGTDNGYEYCDFIEFQKEFMNSDIFIEKMNISDIVSSEGLFYNIFSDHSTNASVYNLSHSHIEIDCKKEIFEYCKINHCNYDIFFMGITALVVSYLTLQSDIAFSRVPQYGMLTEFERVIGPYADYLPINIAIKNCDTFANLLETMQNSNIFCNDKYINQPVYTKEQKNLLYFYHKNEIYKCLDGNINVDCYCPEKSEFCIISEIAEYENSFMVSVSYAKEHYISSTIDALKNLYINIIKNVVNKAQLAINEFSICTTAEKELILNEFNATEKEYPRDKTVAELFEEEVKKHPDSTALVFEDRSLTYSELNTMANSLAYKLREFGIKPDDFVAIIADRSIEMVAGIYGIIKAGGAYVPIDPIYPKDRICFMLEDCAPKAVLKYTAESIKISNQIPVIDLKNEEIWKSAPDNPKYVNTSNDLIYCIYTSGTTGKPKGVMIEHYGVLNLREYFIQKQGLNENDNVIQFASVAFDATVSEMTMGLLCGACMHVISAEIQKDTKAFERYISENKISIAILPPAYLAQVKINGLRTIITAGSETNRELVNKNRNVPVYSNDYGPTEVTVCATYWKHDSNDEVPEHVPIGKPMNNKKVYILNGEVLCGIGVPGELCIRQWWNSLRNRWKELLTTSHLCLRTKV